MLPMMGNSLGPGGCRSFAAPLWVLVPKIAFLVTTVAINVVINIARVMSPGVHRDGKIPAAKSVERNELVMAFVDVSMVHQELELPGVFVVNLKLGHDLEKLRDH